jgi:hypothetical protein
MSATHRKGLNEADEACAKLASDLAKSNIKREELMGDKIRVKSEMEELAKEIAACKVDKKAMGAMGKQEKKSVSEAEIRGGKAFKARIAQAKSWTDARSTANLCFICKSTFVVSQGRGRGGKESFSIECDGCKAWSCLICAGGDASIADQECFFCTADLGCEYFSSIPGKSELRRVTAAAAAAAITAAAAAAAAGAATAAAAAVVAAALAPANGAALAAAAGACDAVAAAADQDESTLEDEGEE